MTELLGQPVVDGVPLLVFFLLAAPVTAALSRRPLRLVGFGGAMVFSLDSAVLALVLWAGLTAVAQAGTETSAVLVGFLAWLPWIGGYAAAELLTRERRTAVRLYNVFLSAVAAALFVVAALASRAGVASLLTGDPSPAGVGPWDLAAVVAASAAYVATDLVLTSLWVVRLEGGRLLDTLRDPAGGVAMVTVLAVNATAVLAALVLTWTAWGLLLLVPVAVALVLTTRTSTLALAEHARSQAMYTAAAGCQTATTVDDVVATVTAAAEAATAAPAAVQQEPPTEEQEGSFVAVGDDVRWLVVGPRANRHLFTDEDRTVVATLAALCEQTMSRLRALEDVRWLAEHDTLTGLLNRGAFMAAAAEGAGAGSAMLFCDVDRFKAVNDTFGHAAGDALLVALARCLEEVVGAEGVVGRIGGDELVVFLPDTTAERLEVIASTIVAAAQVPLAAVGEGLGLGLSVGVAAVAELAPTARARSQEELTEALLDGADGRMYASKGGRDLSRR
ncbi:GGDEF domain-containing protein [Aquipuribacter nitratireducens]|uniref:Diguanylate cyclase domain-containing protein n=1 Tax=Aquipuribacter nitratireducens TaxID=650104 RepID=A0ABW0GNZ9_9MICO